MDQERQEAFDAWRDHLKQVYAMDKGTIADFVDPTGAIFNVRIGTYVDEAQTVIHHSPVKTLNITELAEFLVDNAGKSATIEIVTA